MTNSKKPQKNRKPTEKESKFIQHFREGLMAGNVIAGMVAFTAGEKTAMKMKNKLSNVLFEAITKDFKDKFGEDADFGDFYQKFKPEIWKDIDESFDDDDHEEEDHDPVLEFTSNYEPGDEIISIVRCPNDCGNKCGGIAIRWTPEVEEHINPEAIEAMRDSFNSWCNEQILELSDREEE